jgi:hypothetical protein
MLQQAHGQRAERVEADRKQLLDAVQHAVQLMQQQVTQLEDKGWQNAYMAGKLVEVRRQSPAGASPTWLA